MRLLLVSDIVQKELFDNKGLQSEGKIDMIISCGDLPPEYLRGLRHHFDVPLFYVLGNHDIRYGSSLLPGCENIHQRLVTTHDVKLLGFSGSRWYNGGMNQYTEEEMARMVSRMRFTLWRKKGVDIIVTHAPPRHIHDGEDPCHKGFKSFVSVIDRYRPRYFLHGHIHKYFRSPSDRVSVIDGTRVINCYGHYILEI